MMWIIAKVGLRQYQLRLRTGKAKRWAVLMGGAINLSLISTHFAYSLQRFSGLSIDDP